MNSQPLTPQRLRLQKLARRIGDFNLVADFEVQPGERAALVGPSGLGKTSVLRMIAGLDDPESGSVLLGSEDLTRQPAESRRVGYVFQEHALLDSLDVLDNASFGLRMQGVGKQEREALALDWLDRVGLKSRACARIEVLSGGEAQRVALVRAFVSRPRIMLLDEPFSALDPALRQQLRAELRGLLDSWPVPTVLVTHDESDLQALGASRISATVTRDQSGLERRRFERVAGPASEPLS